MRRELGFGVAALRRPASLRLAAWSLPEALPAAVTGLAVARAVDAGFLAGRPGVGLAWLGALLAASAIGALGSRQVYRQLGGLVEPFRDDLVRRVVAGAIRGAVAGRADGGALARLTRQVEVVRDTYAGLIMVLRGFLVTVLGVAAGMLSIAPVLVPLMLVPFLLGLAAFVATLGLAAARHRDAVRADERLAGATGGVLAGARDVVARGAERHAAALVAGPVAEQAAAERALARVALLRALCFAVGGWLPLVVLLASAGWLVDRGLTVGAVLGALTYVLAGLQPALRTLISGVGGAGLRFVVTLGRILDAGAEPATTPAEAGTAQPAVQSADAPVGGGLAGSSGADGSTGPVTAGRAVAGGALALRGVSFAYGPHAGPVLREFDLTVADGEHLAIVGPSGIGKSTLANLLCGLLRPDSGTVEIGGRTVRELPPERLAAARVLIPQEAYVFTGPVRENIGYLCPAATPADIWTAGAAVGAAGLVDRLGGLDAEVVPAALSAGERQLIALARAYLSPARLVILDEATCHLDPAAEQVAEDAFAARPGTLIVIAHRISSAVRAARVLVLDGTTAASGDHESVLAVSPLYRDLLSAWQPTSQGQPVG